jgi:hypothetical protein
MKNSDPNCNWAARPSDLAPLIPAPRRRPITGTTTNLFTARLTIDVTPELCGCIKLSAFERGVTMPNMLRGLLAHDFPDKAGDVA